jgi:hypothetical protein
MSLDIAVRALAVPFRKDGCVVNGVSETETSRSDQPARNVKGGDDV